MQENRVIAIGWSAVDLRAGPEAVDRAVERYEADKPLQVRTVKRKHIETFLSIPEGALVMATCGPQFFLGLAGNVRAHRVEPEWQELDIANTLHVEWIRLARGPKPFGREAASVGLRAELGERGKTVHSMAEHAEELGRLAEKSAGTRSARWP